jgi:hypothetical protein
MNFSNVCDQRKITVARRKGSSATIPTEHKLYLLKYFPMKNKKIRIGKHKEIRKFGTNSGEDLFYKFECLTEGQHYRIVTSDLITCSFNHDRVDKFCEEKISYWSKLLCKKLNKCSPPLVSNGSECTPPNVSNTCLPNSYGMVPRNK